MQELLDPILGAYICMHYVYQHQFVVWFMAAEPPHSLVKRLLYIDEYARGTTGNPLKYRPPAQEL